MGASLDCIPSHQSRILRKNVHGERKQRMKNSEQKPPQPSYETSDQLWMVPYTRNPYFSGREAELNEIALFLKTEQHGTSGLAISGAGGTGKTHLALEYAYRHREEYHHVFWLQAATRDTLNAAYSDLAHLLNLPEKAEQDQWMLVEAVKRWLAHHHNWLLILDHADDLPLSRNYLPATFDGHLLLTTRASTTGKLARRIKLKSLTLEESSHFLLRRCGMLNEASELADIPLRDVEAARAIASELGELPLALNLAGAYITETACGLSGYLERLQRKRSVAARPGNEDENQLGPVEKAVYVSYEKAVKAGSATADLLRLCSFLAPDEIPEALFNTGASVLSKPLQKLINNPARLNTALASLQKYALLERDPEILALAMPRDVQTTLRKMLAVDEEKAWAEKTVRMVGSVFPLLEIDDWEACQRLLPHTQMCAELIDRWNLELVEEAWLLHHAGWYLHTRGEYAGAQTYEEKALTIYRAVLGDEHPSTAMILNNLAITYEDRGKLKDAATLHQQALAIRRSTLGEKHVETANSLHSLALIYRKQGKLEDAASSHREALAIRQHLLGERHAETATSLTDLAMVYHDQGKLEEAFSLHQRALTIRRKTLGSKHAETIAILNSLASVCQAQGKFDEAIDWLQQALVAQRKTLDHGQIDCSATLSNLAFVYQAQGKLDTAAFWLQQALVAQRGALGYEQPDLAQALETLAIAYEEQEQNNKAEALYLQALSIYHQACGDNSPDTARCSYNLAQLYQEQKRSREARPLFEQALSIWQTHYGPDHANTRKAREKLEQLTQKRQEARARREQNMQQTQQTTSSRPLKGIIRAIGGVGRGKH